jgi:AmmeMemoRadiSam system protein B
MSNHDLKIRRAAVAGTFYPADPSALRAALAQSFAGAVPVDSAAVSPRAVIVPHAGYRYSGPIAASAYMRLRMGRETIRKVVLLGPSHHVAFRGLAVSSADAFATPLGLVPIDDELRSLALRAPAVVVDDAAHAREHSLEVQIPFLQTVLDNFTLLPLVVGDATADEVAGVLEVCWTRADTVVVVSTDLSHYLRYGDAVIQDTHTAAAIAAKRPTQIHGADACGARPLRGLLAIAEARHMSVEQLDLRNSGDTAGDRSRVVGYGAFAVA